jgi:ribosomal protein L44E
MATNQKSRAQFAVQRVNQSDSAPNHSSTSQRLGLRATTSIGSTVTPKQKGKTKSQKEQLVAFDDNRPDEADSDISADEADEPKSLKRRRVSSVFDYAEKLSENEYKCKLCQKVGIFSMQNHLHHFHFY